MGAQFCSAGQGHDVMNMLKPGEIDVTHFGLPRSYPSEQHALEVAEMIARDRDATKSFESTMVIPDLFDIKEPSMQDPPGVYIAVHRTTGMIRRLHSFRKPSGAEQQERLRMHLLRFKALRCEGVARILEIFEDCRSISLVMEHCSGGTMYDRILQRQYFAEQESAMLVRHVLQSLGYLHRNGLSHGHASPESFRFHSNEPHASLKLVDFGLELKVRLCEATRVGPETGEEDDEREAHPRTACFSLLEACRVVFCAPEVLRQLQAETTWQAQIMPLAGKPLFGEYGDPLDGNLLTEVIDNHLEQKIEDFGMRDSLELADVWSVGAITFLLLCGYPPFFAPCRNAIMSRVEKVDFSFDPPFWSKISEDAKDFVQRCLQGVPERRLTAAQALKHPWINRLADTSPSGSMLSSFSLNLRRFYRTSLIEVFAANSLAAKLSYRQSFDLRVRCRDADSGRSGFLTATDLRQVLHGLGHDEIAEAIGMCFSRALRHPGESYIDYSALLESVQLRHEYLLEEELWAQFREFDVASGSAAGKLPLPLLTSFLEAPEIQSLLKREGSEDGAVFSMRESGSPLRGSSPQEADFIETVSVMLGQIRRFTSRASSAATQGSVEA